MIDRTLPRPSVTTLVIHHDRPVVLMGRRSGVGVFAHLARLAEFGEAWREWPNHPETSLEPIHAEATQTADGGMTVTIPRGMGFTLTNVESH